MTAILQQVSAALVETVAAAEPGVVRVEGRRRLPSTGLVWSADGLIVTSSHALERERDLSIGLSGDRRVAATLVGRDAATDLAVLRAEASGLTALPWAAPDEAAVGTLVLALGRPSHNILATLGLLSAVDGPWTTPAGGQIDHYLQTDAVMYPGFSGGPLVTGDLRVVGMNSSSLVPGLGVAVPLPTIQRVVEALTQGKRVFRGYLGVTAQSVKLPESLAAQLGQTNGLLLTHVEPRSPADKGRLVQGDTLVQLNGRPLRDLRDLQAVLGGEAASSPVPLKLVRAGSLREVTVTIGERVS
jgi:S1-C subfamily serine protease